MLRPEICQQLITLMALPLCIWAASFLLHESCRAWNCLAHDTQTDCGALPFRSAPGLTLWATSCFEKCGATQGSWQAGVQQTTLPDTRNLSQGVG